MSLSACWILLSYLYQIPTAVQVFLNLNFGFGKYFTCIVVCVALQLNIAFFEFGFDDIKCPISLVKLKVMVPSVSL